MVLELQVPFNPEPKYKFCLFCSEDDPPLYFVINSEINPFIQQREHLLEQQVTVPAIELDGRLYKESYLDCSQTFSNFSHQEVCDMIEANRSCYMGRLSDSVLADVVEVVQGSMTIRPEEKRSILTGLVKDDS